MDSTYNQGLCGLLEAVEDLHPILVNLKKADVIWAFGDEILNGIEGPGVYCVTNTNNVVKSSGITKDDIDTNNNNDYYIYGGIAAGIFAIFAIIMVLSQKIKNVKKSIEWRC